MHSCKLYYNVQHTFFKIQYFTTVFSQKKEGSMSYAAMVSLDK